MREREEERISSYGGVRPKLSLSLNPYLLFPATIQYTSKGMLTNRRGRKGPKQETEV
jgi:hypothetical protein